MEVKRCLFAFWLGLRSPDPSDMAGLTGMTLSINYTNSVIVCFYASIAMNTSVNSFFTHFNTQSSFCRPIKALATQGFTFVQMVIPP